MPSRSGVEEKKPAFKKTNIGNEVAVREFEFVLPSYETVTAEELNFVITLANGGVIAEHVTSSEYVIFAEYR